MRLAGRLQHCLRPPAFIRFLFDAMTTLHSSPVSCLLRKKTKPSTRCFSALEGDGVLGDVSHCAECQEIPGLAWGPGLPPLPAPCPRSEQGLAVGASWKPTARSAPLGGRRQTAETGGECGRTCRDQAAGRRAAQRLRLRPARPHRRLQRRRSKTLNSPAAPR